jgi:hypothetical protein
VRSRPGTSVSIKEKELGRGPGFVRRMVAILLGRTLPAQSGTEGIIKQANRAANQLGGLLD